MNIFTNLEQPSSRTWIAVDRRNSCGAILLVLAVSILIAASGSTVGQTPTPTPVSLIQFSSATFTDDESQVATLFISRTGSTTGTSIVTFSTVSGGTATAGTTCGTGVDYQTHTQTVTFQPIETSKVVNVMLCGDVSADKNETIRTSLTAPNAGTVIGTIGAATITINDTANQFRNTNSIILGPENGSPSQTAINVTGGTANTFRIRVTLFDLYNEFPDNIDILLVGPNGAKYILMGDVGGQTSILTNNAVTLTFADYPNAVLPDAGPLLTGIFKPTNCETPVSNFPSPIPVGPYIEPGCVVARSNAQSFYGNFAGTTANGIWNLYIRDDFGQARILEPEVVRGEIKGGWGLELVPSTASGVEVSGRVLTPDGRGLRNAVVTIADTNGKKRFATTGSFGYFSFYDVETGSRVISVESKRYCFDPRVLNIVDAVSGVEFLAQE